MNIQRAMMAVCALLVLGGAVSVSAASLPPPSNPVVAVQGARHLMERVSRAKTPRPMVVLMSNRSAAVMGMMMSGFCLAAADLGTETEKAVGKAPENSRFHKLASALSALDKHYGVSATMPNSPSLAGKGREYALAVLAAIARDIPDKDASVMQKADALPPANSFKYAVTRPGVVRISMANGANFPDTDRPYAEALWEDGQWRLDCLGLPSGEHNK